MYDIIMG